MKSIYRALTVSMVGVAALPTLAADFKLADDIEGKFNSTLSLGSQIRAQDANPDVYSRQPSLQVPGIAPGKLAGQTNGSDLNYTKGKPISTVAKGAFDLDLKRQNLGLFVRANVWHDLVQGQDAMRYGNFPNGFTPNTPLSDRGFAPSAKFSNAELRDFFAYGKFDLGSGSSLDAKLGRQVLQWGGSQFIGGGIGAATNPTDFASLLRPGALPTDGKLPVGMLSAKLNTGTAWSVEGFVPYESRSTVLPGCGTYFDVASYAPEGCNIAALAGASEQTRLATNNYIHRNPNATAKNHGQFGLSLGYKAESLNTDFRGYVMNTHNTMPGIRMTVNSLGLGTAAANYADVYAEDVALYGLSFNTKIDQTASVFGEVAYRPNQAINLNAFDVVSAFVLRQGILAQNKGTTSIPVGGTFDAFDRFGVVTASLGGNKVFPKVIGAERALIAGEVGISHINGLPDPHAMRYGRQLPYNGASYTNASGSPTACADTVPGKTCTTDGYITSNAWGLRMLMSATYPGVLGATVTPSLLLARDVRGYSFDGTFSQGRTTVRPSIRADWGKSYYTELQYTRFFGGAYNLAADRSYIGLVAGVRF